MQLWARASLRASLRACAEGRRERRRGRFLQHISGEFWDELAELQTADDARPARFVAHRLAQSQRQALPAQDEVSVLCLHTTVCHAAWAAPYRWVG